MSQINDAFGRPLYEAMRGTPPPTWEQTCLDLDKKLVDSRQHVTELENRLRALWDKLEGERKHYMERIEKLEEAGDAMAERCEVDIENWYRTKKGEL
jgi:predicted phage gp36 major capsid-like protein